jgi:hypothetical protein
MTILRDRLSNRLLSIEQKQEVKRVISEPDRMVAEDTLKLLGVPTLGLSKAEMVEMVMEQKKRGNFSPSQTKQMVELDADHQVGDKRGKDILEYKITGDSSTGVDRSS